VVIFKFSITGGGIIEYKQKDRCKIEVSLGKSFLLICCI